jgi:hypothetical protein
MSAAPTDEADSANYRIKTQAAPFARAVRETGLVAITSAAPDEQAAPTHRADPASGQQSPRARRSR